MDLEAARSALAGEIKTAQESNLNGRFSGARRVITAAGIEALQIEYSNGLSFGDVLLHASGAPRTPDRRNFAVLVIEAIAVDGLIPTTSERADIDRNLCTLAESALPEILNRFKYPFKAQSYEKRRALEGLRTSVVELLGPLTSPAHDLAGLLVNRSKLTKCLADGTVETYFGVSSVRDLLGGVQRVFETLSDLREQSDPTFHAKLRMAEEAVVHLRDSLQGRSGDVADAVASFLSAAQDVVSQLARDTAPLLVSEIGTARPEPRVAAKRYQLHEERDLRVVIPLINKGPGWAYEVTVQGVAESESIYVDGEILGIGDVRPGEFSIVLPVRVRAPCREAAMLLDVSWRMAGTPEKQNRIFSVVLDAQRADVDWSDLETRDPYSITVAEGPRFVGRVARVRSISSRFTREVMESVLIEGQKRVGKSSLALAVRDAVIAQSNGHTHVIYREFGDYGSADPSGTVAALGRMIADEILVYLPAGDPKPQLDFQGTLAPLSQLARILQNRCPTRRFLVILDEFDEIHPELYQHGRLADVFFQNLRTFSAQKNIGMMLVGGERLRYILSHQGDQLNRFSLEHLSYFSRSAPEWEDYSALVQRPSQPDINWDLACVTRLFELTNGHPYFTKLLCREAYRAAVAGRDTEITLAEVEAAVANLAGGLDLNHFAHFWMDGIFADVDVAPSIELDRRRLLITAARARRSGQPIQLDSIVQHKDALLGAEKVKPYLDEFVHREILREERSTYRFNLPLFEDWLVNAGVTKLIPEQSAQEQAALVRRPYDEAFVTSTEIAKLTSGWPVYRGQAVGPERLRAWLDQVPSNLDQRILFRLLQRVRFVSERDIREKLNLAHATVRRLTNPRIPASRAQRRYDLVVTYVDGEGKSGQYYATKYADENLLSAQWCVIGQVDFARRTHELERERGPLTGIVIVDDVVATGESMKANLRSFLAANPMIIERGIPVIVVVLFATAAGEQNLREVMVAEMGSNVDLRVCEHIETTLQAFSDHDAWTSQGEAERAHGLVRSLGARIYKNHPLGYGDLGLLLVFPQTVPNNSLPILHSLAKGADRWEPLFPRPVN